MDVYTPKSSRHHHTDGAYFGTGFPHMLFMVHPEYRPKKPTNQFVPRLYGFKIHPLAYQIQQQGASNFKVPMRTVSYNNGRKWGWNVLLCHLLHSMLPFSIATSKPFRFDPWTTRVVHNKLMDKKKVNFFSGEVQCIHLSNCQFNYSNDLCSKPAPATPQKDKMITNFLCLPRTSADWVLGRDCRLDGCLFFTFVFFFCCHYKFQK